MIRTILIGSILPAAALWTGAAQACLPPPPEAPIPREAGESDAAWQERSARLRAAARVQAQADYEAWALNREQFLWDGAHVTRLAVVEVTGFGADNPDLPPSPTIDFVFTVVAPERGMAAGEQFTLTEQRWSTNPCIPVATYPLGQRYILFADNRPLLRRCDPFLLLPAAEVRSERGRALLRQAGNSTAGSPASD